MPAHRFPAPARTPVDRRQLLDRKCLEAAQPADCARRGPQRLRDVLDKTNIRHRHGGGFPYAVAALAEFVGNVIAHLRELSEQMSKSYPLTRFVLRRHATIID